MIVKGSSNGHQRKELIDVGKLLVAKERHKESREEEEILQLRGEGEKQVEKEGQKGEIPTSYMKSPKKSP